MSAPSADRRAADAHAAGILPLDHFGMMAWCQENVDDFATMSSADRHAYASRVQVMLALLSSQAAAIPAAATMDAAMGDDGSTSLKTEQRETSMGLEDHVSESVLTIAGRIRQTTFALPLDLCNHTILTAWCIVNVAGFADSEARARRNICDAVAQHLLKARRNNEDNEEVRPARYEDADDYFETKDGRRDRLEEEAWYNNVDESDNSIADRFPCRELNYASLLNVTAWCTVAVDGFAESGHSARWEMATAVQDILEEKYGDWEDSWEDMAD